MKIQHVKIRNVLGQQEVEFDVRSRGFTVIAGANSAGKTSILRAIQAVIGGGHDATLLRQGAEQGEVVLVLDDGTTVAKRVGARDSKLAVCLPMAGALSAPKAWLDRVAGRSLVDAGEFLSAKPDRRVRLLAEAAAGGGEKELGELRGIVERLDLPAKAVAGWTTPLEALGVVERAAYDRRRDLNRSAEEKLAAVRELAREAEGSGDPAALRERLTEARRLREEARERWVAAVNEANVAAIESVGRIRRDEESKKEGARDAVLCGPENTQLKALQAERDAVDAQLLMLKERRAKLENDIAHACREVEATHKDALRRVEEQARAEVEEARRRADAEVAALNLEEQKSEADHRVLRAGLEGALAAAERAARSREIAGRMSAEAEGIARRAAEHTEALDRLRAMRGALVGRIPVEGLEVRDGEVWLQGRPWDKLAASERVAVALEVATASVGELRFLWIDGLETLDDAHLEALERAAEERDVQVVCTRVDPQGGELRVEAKP